MLRLHEQRGKTVDVEEKIRELSERMDVAYVTANLPDMLART